MQTVVVVRPKLYLPTREEMQNDLLQPHTEHLPCLPRRQFHLDKYMPGPRPTDIINKQTNKQTKGYNFG